MAIDKSFGEQLKATRKSQGVTAQKIAQTCGISRSFLTLIENGQRLPGKKNIPKIATALKLKTTVVLNWYLKELSRQIKISVGD